MTYSNRHDTCAGPVNKSREWGWYESVCIQPPWNVCMIEKRDLQYWRTSEVDSSNGRIGNISCHHHSWPCTHTHTHCPPTLTLIELNVIDSLSLRVKLSVLSAQYWLHEVSIAVSLSQCLQILNNLLFTTHASCFSSASQIRYQFVFTFSF